MGRYWRAEHGHIWHNRVEIRRNSHRLVVDLLEQIIDIVGDVFRVHGTDDILYGLRPRKAVKLLRAMNTRELEDQCEAQCGVALHTRDDIRSLIVHPLTFARV